MNVRLRDPCRSLLPATIEPPGEQREQQKRPGCEEGQEVRAEGEPFDPTFHQAVSEQEDEKVEAGRVLTELQKGYLLHGRLIRPAMVIVSKGVPDE